MIQKLFFMAERDRIELKYVDQRHDGIEGWIRKGDGEWIRLDFMLEYFISNNVEITKRFKGRINDPNLAKRFYSELLDKFKKETNQGMDFNLDRYNSWLKQGDEIEKVRKSL